jgi:starch-binding outer membrane protein, SusD/RagB family
MRLRYLLPGILLVAAAGCDSVLQTEPVDRIPVENSIVDAGSARAALIGAYDALQDLGYYGRNFQILSELSSDNVEHVGTFQYLGFIDRNLQLQADNSAVESVWSAIYTALARVNLILQKVPGVPGLTDAQRNQILGEAHFLRALHLHNLTKYWGAIPMPLEPAESAEQAAQITRTPVAEVYTQILADLTDAEALMGSSAQTRQASRGAVRALRARVMLYQGNWAGALAAANQVLGMSYSLAPDFADLFSEDGSNTPEDIFRITFTPQEYNELGYYYLWDGRWETAPTADLVSAFETGDLRMPLTVEEDDGDIQGTKFPTTIGGEDLHVIRLAEVILIKAEALAQLDRFTEAVTEYNRVRARASLDPHTFGVEVTDKASVLNAIVHERRVELALEGDRWHDLVRTQRALAILGIPANRLVYPIPAAEVVITGMGQNPGY